MSCLKCTNHKVINDPDPLDPFNFDDLAVVCTITENKNVEAYSKYVSDRSEFRPIAISCRPYRLEKESAIPSWCPLME